MKGKAIVKIILCSLLAVVLVGLLVSGLFMNYQGGIPALRMNLGDNTAAYTVMDSATASISGQITALDISWVNGSVSVVPYDGDQVLLECSQVNETRQKPRYLLKDGVLYIRDREGGVEFFGFDLVEKSLKVSIPADWVKLEKMKLECVSAEITLEGLDAETIRLETVSGEVRCDQLTAETLEIETVSGSVELEGQITTLDCESTSGDLTAQLSNTPGQVECESVSGNVDLTIPGDSSFRLELDSVSGDVRIDGFAVNINGDSYTCGDGSNRYEMDSVSGDFILRAK